MISIDMKKIVCIQILLWVLCLINVSAQSSYKGYEQNVYVSSQGDSLRYCLLRPEVEKPGEKYPLVLFLHGAGERGNDNRKQLKHGGQMWLNPVNRKNIRLLSCYLNVLQKIIGGMQRVLILSNLLRCLTIRNSPLLYVR